MSCPSAKRSEPVSEIDRMAAGLERKLAEAEAEFEAERVKEWRAIADAKRFGSPAPNFWERRFAAERRVKALRELIEALKGA